MNSASSAQLTRIAVFAGMLFAVAVGFVTTRVVGADSPDAVFSGLIAGGAVFVGAVGFALVLLWFGLLRLPATVRTRRVQMVVPDAFVVEADMTREFRDWIQRHRLTAAAISRFGVTISADSGGLTIWAGTGFTPHRAAVLAWPAVTRLSPVDYIGATTSQNAVIIEFAMAEPELRIPLILPPSSGGDSGDYTEARAIGDELERIRTSALRDQAGGT